MKSLSKLCVVIFFVIAYLPLLAQERVIEGVVNDGSSPLVGVTVQVKGTNILTSTGADGGFQINATVGQTIVFTRVGYLALKRTVPKNGYLTVLMNEDQAGFEEVVVVAYGTRQSKASNLADISIITNFFINFLT